MFRLCRAIWRILITVPPLWVLVFNQMLLVQVGLAEGHSRAITECRENIKYEQAVKSAEDNVWVFNGLYVEHYDTNGDGKTDIETLSQTDRSSEHHRENPVFWIVDTDLDGSPDAIYIDKKGLGVCTDIVLYEDLNVRPYSEEKPPVERGGKL